MTETANIDTADLRAKYGRAKYGSYSLWSHAEIEADITALCDALEQARGSFGTLWHEFEATSRRMVELTEDAHTIRAKVRAEVAEEIEAAFRHWEQGATARPRVERGGFLNDRDWCLAIVRGDAVRMPESAQEGTEGPDAYPSEGVALPPVLSARGTGKPAGAIARAEDVQHARNQEETR